MLGLLSMSWRICEKNVCVKCLFPSKPLTKIRSASQRFCRQNGDLPTVFWSKVLIGISISHNLFFQPMRQLTLYMSRITVLKFSYYKYVFLSFYVNMSLNPYFNFLIGEFLWSEKNFFTIILDQAGATKWVVDRVKY